MRKLLIISLLCFGSDMYAQNIIGTWKRISSVLEYTNGKSDDLQKNLASTFPCSSDIKYVFENSGKHSMILPKGCGNFPNITADWTMTGSNLFMTQKVGQQVTNTNYEVSFSGKTMTMVHNYTEAEKSPKTKRLVIKYEKL